jgi:hypothetical protein
MEARLKPNILKEAPWNGFLAIVETYRKVEKVRG